MKYTMTLATVGLGLSLRCPTKEGPGGFGGWGYNSAVQISESERRVAQVEKHFIVHGTVESFEILCHSHRAFGIQDRQHAKKRFGDL